MERVLVSACLLGRPIRYGGGDERSGAVAILERWQREGRLVPVCPEVAVGFPTPRPPAEIRLTAETGRSPGDDVLAGRARVIEATGADVTDLYRRAAHDTATLARRHGCRHAILTDGSPSCGSTFVHDGTFTGASAALRRAGILVWPQGRIAGSDARLRHGAPDPS
ncbi:DUF523 domain-containing protein [Jannaschia sp. LMIT008]|uniref:DUF523 domain-containing protein n=1 Tax=Jannaschia maritima TaxID=3032585 RepID=UPI0028113AE0|nr:DUF523 domain-containing protein [Jannaschia sp. LMIT008]